MIADELRRQGDAFIDLEEIAPEITRRQVEPRARPAPPAPTPAAPPPPRPTRATPADPFADTTPDPEA
jgi:hypothetical protein